MAGRTIAGKKTFRLGGRRQKEPVTIGKKRRWSGGGSWLMEVVLELVESGEEHLVFTVGICPGDGLVFKDVLYDIAGPPAVIGIVEEGDPFRRQVFCRLKSESI